MHISQGASFDPSQDKQAFKDIDNLIEQGQRNAA